METMRNAIVNAYNLNNTTRESLVNVSWDIYSRQIWDPKKDAKYVLIHLPLDKMAAIS